MHEINGPFIRGNNPLIADKILIDLDNNEKDLCLDDIAQISIHYCPRSPQTY